MSHPSAFRLTPADLAIEAGRRGFSVDDLSVLFRGSTEELGMCSSEPRG